MKIGDVLQIKSLDQEPGI